MQRSQEGAAEFGEGREEENEVEEEDEKNKKKNRRRRKKKKANDDNEGGGGVAMRWDAMGWRCKSRNGCRSSSRRTDCCTVSSATAQQRCNCVADGRCNSKGGGGVPWWVHWFFSLFDLDALIR
jgi:hypothetical protein